MMKHRRIKRFFLCLTLLCCLMMSAGVLADPSYKITNYAMEVDVQTDGSALITETLIYEFDGEYNGILSQFDTDGVQGIEDFTVYADGEIVLPVEVMDYEYNTYTLSSEGDIHEVRVYSPGEDDVRVFEYEYTLMGLAHRYEDAGMILRKFIGEENAVPLQNASIVVRFPEEGTIQTFVHGGMSEYQIEKDCVVFGPERVYSGDYVEVRLLFPAEWIADAPAEDGSIIDIALAEEQRLLEEAAALSQRIYLTKYAYLAVYAVVMIACLLLMARKYGVKRTLHCTSDPARVAGWPAAFMTDLMEDAPDADALSGTLVELTMLGRVQLEPEGDDLRFTLLDARTDDLYPHQAQMVNWLFAAAPTFLLKDLNAGNDYDRAQLFERGYSAYCAAVTKDVIAQDLRYPNSGLRIALNAAILLFGCIGAAFALVADQPLMPVGLMLIALTALFMLLASRIRSLTSAGESLKRDIQALKELGCTGDLNRFLPYYTALGMTEPLVEAAPSLAADDTPVWLFAGWQYQLHHMRSTMHDTHTHNASIPDPNASSSSSGGGGSNGGGGGHGAW